MYAISYWLGSGEYKALPTGPDAATEKEDTKVHEAIMYRREIIINQSDINALFTTVSEGI